MIGYGRLMIGFSVFFNTHEHGKHVLIDSIIDKREHH